MIDELKCMTIDLCLLFGFIDVILLERSFCQPSFKKIGLRRYTPIDSELELQFEGFRKNAK